MAGQLAQQVAHHQHRFGVQVVHGKQINDWATAGHVMGVPIKGGLQQLALPAKCL